MEGGPGSKRSPILTDRSADRGFYRAIGVSAAIHVLLLGILFVGGELDLRPETPELYGAGLAGGLPPGLEAQLPSLGGDGVPRVDPEPPPPPKPRVAPESPPPKDPPKQMASAPKKDDREPADVIFPAAVTATPAPTPTPTPRPTASPTPRPTPTGTPDATPPPTASPRATASPSPTPAPTPSRRPKPTATPKPSPPTAPKPTAARTAAPVATEKPAPSPVPEKAEKPDPRPAPEKVEKASPAPAKKADARSAQTAPAKKPTAGEAPEASETQSGSNAPAAGSDRDRRIAEAMERVRARVGSGADEGGSRSVAGTSGGVGGGGVRGGTGTGGFGTGTGGGGALRGADFLLYYNDMITRIRDAWVWVGGSPNLEVEVGFRITPVGDIVDVRVVRASGDPSYDQSVLRALRTVRSLGPPPERHRETFSDVQLTFRPADLERGP